MEKKIKGMPRINELIGNGARIIFVLIELITILKMKYVPP